MNMKENKNDEKGMSKEAAVTGRRDSQWELVQCVYR